MNIYHSYLENMLKYFVIKNCYLSRELADLIALYEISEMAALRINFKMF